MISLFSTCKPFKGSAKTDQTNALRSWRYLDAEVMIFGREAGVYDICEEMGFRQITNLKRVDGIPLLDEIFERAQKAANNDLMVYINGDVIVLDGLTEAIQRADEWFGGHFLLVCRRWDIDLDEALDFGQDWKEHIKTLMGENGELHSTCSTDIFGWRRPLWSLPVNLYYVVLKHSP